MATEAGRMTPVTLGTTLATVLTAGGNWGGKSQIVGVHLSNKSGTIAWARLVVVRGASSYEYLPQRSIDPTDFFDLTTHLILEPGDVLQGQAQTASAIDAFLSGYEQVE